MCQKNWYFTNFRSFASWCSFCCPFRVFCHLILDRLFISRWQGWGFFSHFLELLFDLIWEGKINFRTLGSRYFVSKWWKVILVCCTKKKQNILSCWILVRKSDEPFCRHNHDDFCMFIISEEASNYCGNQKQKLAFIFCNFTWILY